jgi:hypothetical protein
MVIGVSGKMGSGKDTVGKIIKLLASGMRSDAMEWSKQDMDDLDNKEAWNPIYFDKPDSWQIKKFASKLKQIVSIFTGIPVEDLEKQEVKDRVLGEEWDRHRVITKGFPSKYAYSKELAVNEVVIASIIKRYVKESMTVRQLLQEIGTDAMRNVIHPNIWINALFVDYKPLDDSPIYEGDRIIDEGLIYPNWIITDVRFLNELQAIKDKGGITIRINKHNLVESNHLSETALDNAEFDEIIENNGSIEELAQKVKTVLQKHKLIN